MKPKLILLFLCAVPFMCLAQNPLTREYTYDEAGNRISCKVLRLQVPELLLPTDTTNPKPKTENLTPLIEEYFVEKIDRFEIKIYPNPTTEKITLVFSGTDVRVENIRPLQLYSLTGQLLQERPVFSATTEVSLAGLAKGAYILKVNVNGVVEDWKIIKN